MHVPLLMDFRVFLEFCLLHISAILIIFISRLLAGAHLRKKKTKIDEPGAMWKCVRCVFYCLLRMHLTFSCQTIVNCEIYYSMNFIITIHGSAERPNEIVTFGCEYWELHIISLVGNWAGLGTFYVECNPPKWVSELVCLNLALTRKLKPNALKKYFWSFSL